MSKYRMQRYAGTASIVVATDADQIDVSAALNGVLKGILLNIPNLKASDTLTFSILDSDGFTLYTKAALAESTKHALLDQVGSDASTLLPLNVPLSGTLTLRFTTSEDQDSDTDIPFALLIERG